MNYQERIQKIQAKIKSIKNMLGETNDELSKLHNEVVSTPYINETEITEAICFWCNNNIKKCTEVWGDEGATFSSLLEESIKCLQLWMI